MFLRELLTAKGIQWELRIHVCQYG